MSTGLIAPLLLAQLASGHTIYLESVHNAQGRSRERVPGLTSSGQTVSMAGILFSTYFHIKVEYDVDAINRCFKLYVDYMPSKIIHRWLRNHIKTHSTMFM